jgi:carbon monoxide dehydrogenase subunit G
MRDLTATATVAHRPAEVFAFLSDLRNHWRLEERFVELEGVGGAGGRVRVRGPLGISRVARTEVLAAEPPAPVGRLRGRAEIGRTTRGHVRWEIEPVAGGSRVTLAVGADALGATDALLMTVGGRWWMQRLFRSALARLDGAMDAESRD